MFYPGWWRSSSVVSPAAMTWTLSPRLRSCEARSCASPSLFTVSSGRIGPSDTPSSAITHPFAPSRIRSLPSRRPANPRIRELMQTEKANADRADGRCGVILRRARRAHPHATDTPRPITRSVGSDPRGRPWCGVESGSGRSCCLEHNRLDVFGVAVGLARRGLREAFFERDPCLNAASVASRRLFRPGRWRLEVTRGRAPFTTARAVRRRQPVLVCP